VADVEVKIFSSVVYI